MGNIYPPVEWTIADGIGPYVGVEHLTLNPGDKVTGCYDIYLDKYDQDGINLYCASESHSISTSSAGFWYLDREPGRYIKVWRDGSQINAIVYPRELDYFTFIDGATVPMLAVVYPLIWLMMGGMVIIWTPIELALQARRLGYI